MIVRNLKTVTAALVIAGVTAACGGGGSATGSAAKTPASSTTPAPGSAKITSFDVPATATCGDKTSTVATVSYATSGATSVKLLVDGGAALGNAGAPLQIGDPKSGSLQVAVHCDPLPHTFVLVAYDDHQRQTVQQKQLATQ